MKLILTHEQADLDALASLLGAHLLDKNAYAILPRAINRNGVEFINNFQSELGFSKTEDLPREPISEITLVDTQSLITLKGLHAKTKIKVLDHHPRKEGINPEWEFEISRTGACSTLLVEKLKDAKIMISPIQASALLAGIYEDTGSLSYSSTTSRDLVAAAYVLDQGADLELISKYLSPQLTNAQQVLYDRLMQNMETHHIQNQTILTAKANGIDINDEISSVAHKLRDFLDPDALLLFVLTKQGIRLVARATTSAVDVAKIAAALGGGGHTRAASALIRPEGKLNPEDLMVLMDQVYDQTLVDLNKYVRPLISVRHIMSKNPLILTPDTPIQEVARLMQRYGYEGYPVVENGKIVGLLNRRIVDRALNHKMSLSASSLMDAGSITVHPDDSIEALQKVMGSSGWGQIPVVDSQSGAIVGIVTRTDLIKTRSSQKLHPNKEHIINLLKQAISPSRLALLLAIAQEAYAQHVPIYIVGGFVRDLLLGLPSLDFDIVVEGDAIYFVKSLVKTFGGRAISHNRFGTAKWYLDERSVIASKLQSGQVVDPSELPEHLDLITARTEFYEKPAALPTIESSSIKMDLHRRDFTINTLALRLDGDHLGTIFDYWGGLADLEDRKIRVLHALSFVDDATRLTRAVRFEQRFNFEIEDRTLALLNESLPLLEKTTGTRLRHELELIMAEPKASAMFARLHDLGILEAIHPKLNWSLQASEKITLLNSLNIPAGWDIPESIERLSIKQALGFTYWLSGLSDENLNSVQSRLRLSTKLVDLIMQYKILKSELPILTSQKPSKIFHGLSGISKFVIFALYFDNHNKQETDCLEAFINNYSKVQPFTNGTELRKRGLQPSPKYAEIISGLRDAWLDGIIHTQEEENQLLETFLVDSK